MIFPNLTNVSKYVQKSYKYAKLLPFLKVSYHIVIKDMGFDMVAHLSLLRELF